MNVAAVSTMIGYNNVATELIALVKKKKMQEKWSFRISNWLCVSQTILCIKILWFLWQIGRLFIWNIMICVYM